MEISLSSAYTQTSTIQLTQSSQTLNAQPITQDQKLAISNTTPAAIYHPSEEAAAVAETYEVVETYIGRPQSADFPAMARIQESAHYGLKSSFEEFQSALAFVFPDLAEKKFGFTVEADGSLKALNTSGQLSTADMDQLNALLNASSALKTAAGNYRNASIDLVAADGAWGGGYLGRYELNKDNFASTIDLAALFLPKGNTPSSEAIAGLFSHQLWSKGELATPESDAIIIAAREAKQAAETATV